MHSNKHLGTGYLLREETVVVEENKSEMLEKPCAEAEELFVKDMIAQEMMMFEMSQEVKDEILLEKDYNAETGITRWYEEYEELGKLRAKAEEIYAEEWMAADEK